MSNTIMQFYTCPINNTNINFRFSENPQYVESLREKFPNMKILIPETKNFYGDDDTKIPRGMRTFDSLILVEKSDNPTNEHKQRERNCFDLVLLQLEHYIRNAYLCSFVGENYIAYLHEIRADYASQYLYRDGTPTLVTPRPCLRFVLSGQMLLSKC